jgi:hypothetical protein
MCADYNTDMCILKQLYLNMFKLLQNYKISAHIQLNVILNDNTAINLFIKKS